MTLTRFQSKATATASPSARRVHVVTFGCQMNKYDSLLAEGRFRAAGYQTTERIDDADVVLFNTCSVRDHAEERTYSWLGELKRVKQARPALVVGVMGCMAQRVGEEIFARAGHVDIVAGTRQYHHLPELVDEVVSARAGGTTARRLALSMDDEVRVDRSHESYPGGVHAYLTVMRGCDLNCTFCIVPTVRGRVLSYPVEHLVREAEWFVAHGARALTLLGQTVNSYGEDFRPPGDGEPRGRGRQGRTSLADLLHRLQAIDGLARIRLVTSHPSYATRALAEAMRDCDKVERFLPLPAQSGSDRILRAMKRGYNLELYRKRVDVLRSVVPDIELGSDWIVGFPSETDEEHAASESFLAEQGFAVNYVFKYDPRPSTAAEQLVDDVPDELKKARNQRLLACSEVSGLVRHGRHVGGVRSVLVDGVSEKDACVVEGRTQHGLGARVRVSEGVDARALVGSVIEARIDGANAFGLSGTRA
ncbi:MAG: tRNA (N6-isopentenyl adenosine(37)-C2)-methylthiotransferase MiaB [Planctomycetota bacterium]